MESRAARHTEVSYFSWLGGAQVVHVRMRTSRCTQWVVSSICCSWCIMGLVVQMCSGPAVLYGSFARHRWLLPSRAGVEKGGNEIGSASFD